MGKIEFDMPEIENIPDKWKPFAEEAGVEALVCLARHFGGMDMYIPSPKYFVGTHTKPPVSVPPEDSP
jgi:hypothetical protein